MPFERFHYTGNFCVCVLINIINFIAKQSLNGNSGWGKILPADFPPRDWMQVKCYFGERAFLSRKENDTIMSAFKLHLTYSREKEE